MKIYFVPALFISLLACNSNTSSRSETTADTNTAAVHTGGGSTPGKDSSTKNETAEPGDEGHASNNLTVPGKSIGNAVIGANADSLEILFGKPDASDAAMGKAWLTWYGKKPDGQNNKTQLDVYTSYKDTSMREKTVQQVRTTSPFFKTENGVHVYSTFAEVQQAFPGIKRVKQNTADAQKFMVYDDVKNGIAFQVTDTAGRQICTAIFIHIKGKNIRDMYIPAPAL